MGGAVETVSNVVEDAVDAVKDVGSDIDDFVNEEIPGGWYTVGAAAGGAALGSGALGGAGAAEAGAAGAFDMAGVGNAMGGYYGAPVAAGGAFEMGGVGDALGGYYGAPAPVAAGGAFDMGGMGDVTERFVTPSNALKNTMDVLRTGNVLRNMFGQEPAQIPNMQLSQVPQGVVDYSPLLSLLSQRATTPNVQSLLG